MTDWLKLTLQYLYRVRGSIFLHLASCFSIALIASLYHIPIQAIGYMILFISSMALLFLGIGCHQFRRRMQYLRVVWNGADVQLGTLPPAHDAMEQLYQDILRRTAERSTRAWICLPSDGPRSMTCGPSPLRKAEAPSPSSWRRMSTLPRKRP